MSVSDLVSLGILGLSSQHIVGTDILIAITKYLFHTESIVSTTVEPSQIGYETLILRLMSMPVETSSLQQLISTTGIIVCYVIGINV